jgi:hypothetical protein
MLFGEGSLRCVLNEYVDRYHHERNHQGKGNVLSFLPSAKSRYVPALFDVGHGLEASSHTTSVKLPECVGHTGAFHDDRTRPKHCKRYRIHNEIHFRH